MTVDARIAKRLSDRLTPEGGCLVFVGSRTANGYGRLNVNGSVVLAHRLAWMVANDSPVPDGLYVLHSCDNPPCCNPDHLRAGTAADNTADMLRRNRSRTLSGEASPRTKYDDATVELVRSLTADGAATVEIAERTGVPVDYVRKLARGNRRGRSAPGPVDGPRSGPRRLPWDQIAAEYEAGATMTELAERYQTNSGGISRIVRAVGVQTRTPTEALHKAWEKRRKGADR